MKSLKNLHFNRLLLTKIYNVWAKKRTKDLYFITLDCDAKFEEDLTCCLENDKRNWANFHQCTWKSQNVELSLGPFIQSRKYMSLKLTKELYVMTTKNYAKFEKELTCQFIIDSKNLANFDTSSRKSQKFAL